MGAACSKQTLRNNIKVDLTKIVFEGEDWAMWLSIGDISGFS